MNIQENDQVYEKAFGMDHGKIYQMKGIAHVALVHCYNV